MIGVAGALVGTVATGLFAAVTEGKRAERQAAENARQRAHELEVRKLELREDHVGRLHSERRAAYADFYRSLSLLDGPERAMEKAMDAVAKAGDEDDGTSWSALGQVSADYETALAGINERLMLIELVASSPVAAAARGLRAIAPRLLVGSSGPRDETDAQREAEHWQARRAAEDALRDAIRAELELDR